MGDMNYKPLIDDMKWSYSRVESFDSCPYRWYLRYIRGHPEESKFYASYGSFIHKIIERYYRGELSKKQMLIEFFTKFTREVKGERPKESIVKKYIDQGSEYLKSFKPFPFEMIDIEKRVEFSLGGYKFVGFIDYLGEKDGEIYVVDNKSRELKPRSNKNPPTLKDKELDSMLKQLYLYSVAVEQEYNKLPKALCFNCFRNGVFIKEQFDKQKYEETKQWAIDSIEKIANTSEFEPREDFFFCTYICGMSDYCEYSAALQRRRRR